ncbi:MAG TPA: hypothetical protein VGO14_03765 [Solirubrobacteraceae bacterium]|jgi:hypothetical protein|nr:hypothetical protein [Solirubrobacteraceae bacterium]
MNEPRPQTETELIELIRSSEVRAPEALHRRIEQLVADRPATGGRRPAWGIPGAGRSAVLPRLAAVAALAAVLIAVLVVALGGAGRRSLSVGQATALTLSRPTAPAPKETKPSSGELAAAVQGVHFPYWEERFGWRSTGQRTDRLQGHTVMTVFYADRRGRGIGYAIAAGRAPSLSGGSVKWLGGHAYRLLSGNGARTVVWLRNGRLCVLSGRGVSGGTLLRLASGGERAA